MCDTGKKTWLVIDNDGDSHVCKTVKELEDLILGEDGNVTGDNYEITGTVERLLETGCWQVYEISGSEATEIDISFKMKLSIRL